MIKRTYDPDSPTALEYIPKHSKDENKETTTCAPCTDAAGTSTASTASMEEVNHRELEEWDTGTRWHPTGFKGEVGKVYWHPGHKFYVVGVNHGGRVGFVRACINCDKQTLRLSEARCAACGGERQVRNHCEMVDAKTDEPCTNNTHHTNDDGVHMCKKHWVAEDPDTRGCPRCRVQPRRKNRDDGLCDHCVKSNKVEDARDAQRSALEDLMEEEELEEWPGQEAAEPRTRYATLNQQDGYKPYVVIKGGTRAVHACEHHGCRQQAKPNPDTKEYKWCVQHGGGRRCQVHYADLDNAPWAKHTLSDHATLRINGQDIPQLTEVGKAACMRCLRRYDPTHPEVKRHIRKEVMFLDSFVQALVDIGLGWLIGIKSGSSHDCPIGPSHRRPDIYLNAMELLKILVEVDENEHGDRTTSCETAKLGGTLMDLGAPGFDKKEGEFMDYKDEDIAKMPEPERSRILAARKKATDRVTCNGQGASTVNVRCFVLRVNPDGYTTADGTRVAALFKKPKVDAKLADGSLDEEPALEKSAEFLPTVKRMALRVKEIIDAAADPVWLDAQKNLVVEYMRFGDLSKLPENSKRNGKRKMVYEAADV